MPRQFSNALEDFRSRLVGEAGVTSAAQAWFRFYDTERRGLSFPEFCQKLADGGWDGNASELCSALDDGSHYASVTLLDPQSVQELDDLGDWCKQHAGGIFEAFMAVGPACGCVKREDLEEGLRRLGYDGSFDGVWPLLDPWLRGAIFAQDFFGLETNCRKRRELDKHWEQALGKYTAGDSAQSQDEQNATHLLFKLAKESTWLGGKHWKSAKILADAPAIQLGKLPKSGPCRPRPKLEIKRVVRDRPSAKRLEPEFTEPFEPEKQKRQTRSLYGQSNVALLPESQDAHWNQKRPSRRGSAGSVKSLGHQRDQKLFEQYDNLAR